MVRPPYALIAASLLLGLVTADFVRRVAGSSGGRASTGPVAVTASRLISLQAVHELTFVLESFDGSISTVSALFDSKGEPYLAEAEFDDLRLGGVPPIESLPCRGEAESPSTHRVRCRFRDVDWQPLESGPGYSAYLAYDKRVLFVGCEPQDAMRGSATFPFRVQSGPGFEDLRRHLGGK